MEPKDSIDDIVKRQGYVNIERVHSLESRMAAHEVQCEERWKTTFNRLDDIDSHLQRIESRVMAASGTVILFLLGLVASHWV